MSIHILPPILSDYSLGEVFDSLLGTWRNQEELKRSVTSRFNLAYPDRKLLFFPSGTHALANAFTIVGSEPIAVPAYSCPDIGTALQLAGKQAVLYDTDPHTLSPDLDSVRRCLDLGCQYVLVTHLFGFPIDLGRVQDLLTTYGAVLIEDAAQHAGGTYKGFRLGGFGEASILSFGRGKGLNAMGGGALLTSETNIARFHDCPLSGIGKSGGIRTALMAGALRLATRPMSYGFIARVPQLRIGETFYRAPHDTDKMNLVMASLLVRAFDREPMELKQRTSIATFYSTFLPDTTVAIPISPIPDGSPGYLRFPIRLGSPPPRALKSLGMAKSYPRLLNQYFELKGVFLNNASSFAGATELANTLWTLPTHSRVTPDIQKRIKSLLSD